MYCGKSTGEWNIVVSNTYISLTESYKKETKLKKRLNTPEMKKLHKEAMKLQGGDKVIKMVKDQAEA